MEASAQIGKQCNDCKQSFVNQRSAAIENDFIQNAQSKFSEIVDCQTFLNDYNKDPKSVFNLCSSCLSIKQQKWKFSLLQKKCNIQLECNKQSGRRQTIFRGNLPLLAIGFLGLIFVCLFSHFTGSWSMLTVGTNLNNANLKSTINDIMDKLPSLEQGLLKKLKSAFSRLKTPGEPFVFLLLHDDTNKNTTDCLALHTSIMAKKRIFTNTMKSLWINASDWSSYSDHETDNLYKKLIGLLKINEVLVIENLQDLPWSLASELHFLCDSINPTIARAMYILELRVNGGDVGLLRLTDGDKMLAAERAMSTAWTQAPSSYRAALITRLTSYVDVVLIKSDGECSDPAWNSPELEKWFIRISPETNV